ncbi:MAG: pantoate--beta-alanine ligase [Armatimonadota bacterium]
MIVESDPKAVQHLALKQRRQGRTLGLVPTMGAMHEGHLSLIRRCRTENDFCAISIFVNPTQFEPGEDLDTYPRRLEADLACAEEVGVDLAFTPDPAGMYPEGYSTWVIVEGLTENLCGRFRPGHFRGVTTVVSKLFNILLPDRAYFGEKDYQQLVVVRRMVADLNFPVEIRPCPTVREADGLAMSSRNLRLTPEQRAVAPALYRALCTAAEAARRGAIGEQVEKIVQEELARTPGFALQYVEAVEPDTLRRLGSASGPMVLAAAAYLGDVRLIDNVAVGA